MAVNGAELQVPYIQTGRVSSLPPVSCSSSPLTYRFYVLPYVSPRLSINKSRASEQSLSYPVPGGCRGRGLAILGRPVLGTIATRYIPPSYPRVWGTEQATGSYLIADQGSTSSSTATQERGSQARRRDSSAISPTHPACPLSVHHPLLHTQAYCGSRYWDY
jgi:hypothetical protein